MKWKGDKNMRWIRQIFVPLLPFLGSQIGLLIVLAPRGTTEVLESETIPVLTETSETVEPEFLVPRTDLPSDLSGSIVLPLLGPLFALDVMGAFLLFRSLRNQEERFAEKIGVLERSNRDLSDFAHTVSHDLQEPLRVIQHILQRTRRTFEETSESQKPPEPMAFSKPPESPELSKNSPGVVSEDLSEWASKELPEKQSKELLERTSEFATICPVSIGHSLHLAADAANDLSQRIHDILERARIDVAPIRPVRVDVAKILDRVERNLAQAIEERSVVIQRGTLPTITADPVWLEILLQNLIGNALRYGCVPVPTNGERTVSEIQIYVFPGVERSGTSHPEGGMDDPWKIYQSFIPSPHEIATATRRRYERRPTDVSGVERKMRWKGYINERLHPSDERNEPWGDVFDLDASGVWVFAIVDHGPGMANLDSVKMLEPFRQGDPATDSCRHGYGIGLATSRRIVERHGGTIHIAATPGGGTTVWFTLDSNWAKT